MDKFNEKFKPKQVMYNDFSSLFKWKKMRGKIAGWHKIMKRRLINVVNVHFFHRGQRMKTKICHSDQPSGV